MKYNLKEKYNNLLIQNQNLKQELKITQDQKELVYNAFIFKIFWTYKYTKICLNWQLFFSKKDINDYIKVLKDFDYTTYNAIKTKFNI